MNNKVVIALIGKKGSGKDTAANHIQKILRENQIKVGEIQHFAKPLKDFCKKLCGIFLPEEFEFSDENKDKVFSCDHSSWEGYNKVSDSNVVFIDKPFEFPYGHTAVFSPRILLQQIGMTLRETFNDNIFVESLIHKVINEDSDVSIIADVRFPNEIASLKLIFEHVIFIRIIRPNCNNSNHISETALDNYEADYTILNDSDIDAYKQKIELLMQKTEI